ncbi:hypothetical protein MMC07_001725 [Pseudocyphellaria aurata]|nr:hypothetical protein [Pseudocyphellaria aurata]
MESADSTLPFRDIPEVLFPNLKRLQETPRLIDAERFIEGIQADPPTVNTSDLFLPEMIVTLLYNYNMSVLKAFLDPECENIAFCKVDSNDAVNSANPQDQKVFFIKKQGSSLKESSHLKESKTRITSFDVGVQCGSIISPEGNGSYCDEIFEYTIQPSGHWEPISWLHCGPRGPGILVDESHIISQQGKKLANRGLEERWWMDPNEDQIKILTDGTVDLSGDSAQGLKYEKDPELMARLLDIPEGVQNPSRRTFD